MTIKQYLADSSLSMMATVTTIENSDVSIVKLDKTLFHAQGGGQKADQGSIGNAKVLHVYHIGDEVAHVVDNTDSLVVGQIYEITVDKEWRNLNAAYHTAGHLVASVAESLYPDIRAVAGHQWPGEGRVEFEGELSLDSIDLTVINTKISECIKSCLEVSVVGNPYTDRKIQIGYFSPIPCGGTHITNLNQLIETKVTGKKLKNGRIRCGFDIKV